MSDDAIAEDLQHLKDDLAKLKLTLGVCCPRDRLGPSLRAVDDIEVGVVKLELAVRVTPDS